MYFLDFLLTCVFLCSAQECIGFFSGNKKGGMYLCMRKGIFFFRFDGKFISSIFSQQDIYTYLISITQ